MTLLIYTWLMSLRLNRNLLKEEEVKIGLNVASLFVHQPLTKQFGS